MKEASEKVAKDEARKLSTVQEIMVRSTDYLRRIIAPAEGARRRYDQGSRPLSLRAAPLFPKARAKLLQKMDYFSGKTEAPLRGTCEGTDSEEQRQLLKEL